MVNEAQAFKNEMLPKTRGKAYKSVRKAEMYLDEKKQTAAGNTRNFKLRQEGFHSDPSVLKELLFHQSVREALNPSGSKTIVDPDTGISKKEIYNEKFLLRLDGRCYLAKGVPGTNTGIFYVNRSEIAVAQYLGRIHDNALEPGVHYILPWPFGRVDKVGIRQMKTVVVNIFASQKENQNPENEPAPYCITGDNNIVNTTMFIKYNIINPIDYLYRGMETRKEIEFIKGITASAIIHKLSVLSVDDALTIKKNEIETAVKNKLQKELDILRAGIGIAFVEIKAINPPEKIQPFFDDVVNARVDKDKMIHEGVSYRNMIIPEARSRADEMCQAAHSYKNKVIRHAKGNTARFLSQLEEYEKSKAVSKKQIYLEFISQAFPKLGELRMITPDQGSGQ